METILKSANKTKYQLLYDDEQDAFDRKTINSKLQGKENILIIIQYEHHQFGYFTSSKIPFDDDQWKKIPTENSTSFAFVKDYGKFKILHSSSNESCLYLNINNNDDSILLAVRHFFYLRTNGSYISEKTYHYFNYQFNNELIYPNRFDHSKLLIYQLF